MTTDPFVYKSPEGKARCMAVYDAALARWPVPYEQLDLPTRFGSTHSIASGSPAGDAPPLVLLHGNWASAMMWSSAITELSRDYHAYALDQIDDVGRSIPTRIPASRSEYAEWLLDVFDQLGLQQADIVGLSYGGFLAVFSNSSRQIRPPLKEHLREVLMQHIDAYKRRYGYRNARMALMQMHRQARLRSGSGR